MSTDDIRIEDMELTSNLRLGAAALALVGAGFSASAPASAKSRRHRHPQVRSEVVQAPLPDRRPKIPYAYSFYPDEIEGGVSGNLPFNNQIRKMKDPLNANGGR